MMKKKPFVKYNIEDTKVKYIFNIRLKKEERRELNEFKRLLKQPKDSTCIKTLAEIGKIVLQDKKTALIIETLFKNKKNNKRSGITEIE
jgi:hypothetical protein